MNYMVLKGKGAGETGHADFPLNVSGEGDGDGRSGICMATTK